MKTRVIIGVLAIIAAYITTVVLYADTGLGRPSEVIGGVPAADGTTVTIDLTEVHAARNEVVANVTVSPGPDLFDRVTHGLDEDISIAIHSSVAPTRHSWAKGALPGVFSVTLPVVGDPGSYPFDSYRTGPIMVQLFKGSSAVPERLSPAFVDRTAGWLFDIPVDDDGSAPATYRVNVQRSPSTAAFAAVMVLSMVTIATLGMTVAVQTMLKRRKFQPPMTTWFAALVFAVVPLRNALPDAPAIGTWIDVTVILWVVVALVVAMSIYITCWWYQTKPEPEPADQKV